MPRQRSNAIVQKVGPLAKRPTVMLGDRALLIKHLSAFGFTPEGAAVIANILIFALGYEAAPVGAKPVRPRLELSRYDLQQAERLLKALATQERAALQLAARTNEVLRVELQAMIMMLDKMIVELLKRTSDEGKKLDNMIEAVISVMDEKADHSLARQIRA